MVPIKNIEEIEEYLKQKHSNNLNSRIIGIILARDISSNRQFIIDNYPYWHEFSGIPFDIFWAGYGAYYNEDDQKKMQLTSIPLRGHGYEIQFDIKAFVDIKEKISKSINDLKYTDSYPILVLINYNNHTIDFNKNLIVKLIDDSKSGNEIREKMEEVIKYAKICPTIEDLDSYINQKKRSSDIFMLNELFSG